MGYATLQRLWPAPGGVVVQGVIVGSLTALVAFGLALIYRSSRVINFAQADIGAVPAALAISLLTWQELRGGTVVDKGWPYVVCMLIGLVAALALGMLVERLVVRRFSKSPRLILMVVTLGLAQIFTGLAQVIPTFFTEGPRPAVPLVNRPYESPFGFSFAIDPVRFSGNDLMAVVMAIVCIAGLFAFLRYTNIGVAIRASAESSDRASMLGINVGLTQNAAWAVAALLSTVAMLLRAGLMGLPLGGAFGPTIMVRALAAAVIGRMENFTAIYVASCALGVIETAIIWNTGSATLVDPALFVIVIAVLLLQRRGRESRVDDQATWSWQDTATVRPIPRELRRLPEVRWGIRGLLAVAATALLVLPLFLADNKTNLASAVFIYAVIGLSLVVLTGWAGEISLGQVAFVGIGAAVGGALNVHYGWDVTVAVPVAGLVGAVASVVIGLPALRIRGLFLTVSTLAFAVATSSYLLNGDYFSYLPGDLDLIERTPLLGRVDISGERGFYYVTLGMLVATLWAVHALQRYRTGRILVATRDNDRAARAFGVSPTRAKLTAFALAGFFASSAGSLFVAHQRFLGNDVFQPVESIRALTMVVVGGLGSAAGAILGAVFVKSTEWFNTLVPTTYRPLFTLAGSGTGLLLVLWFLPGGLGSLMYRLRDALLKWVADRRGLVVPSLVADVAPRREDLPDLTLLGGDSTELLEILSLDVAYGQVQVLFDVTLDIEGGGVIALLGTNGAGKSTVLRAVSGLVSPRSGGIWFNGSDITGLPPHRIAELGIIQVPGGRGVFPSLTVAENLRVAAWMFRRDPDYVREATEEVLGTFPVLSSRLGAKAANLSGGQQQMLALAMAFIAKPKLLMIDELSLGLAPRVVDELLQVVNNLVERGTTVILVEQSVNVALTVADTAYFMEKGEVRFRGPTADLLDRPDVLRSVFLEGAATHTQNGTGNGNGHGSGKDQPSRRRVRTAPIEVAVDRLAGRPVVLETRSMAKHFAGVTAVDDVSIALREGEVLGIIGPNGAGKTTLFDLVSGFLVPDGGTTLFDGRDITDARPEERSRLGLARSFQDARLFSGLTVHQTIAVALDRHLRGAGPVAVTRHLLRVGAAERRLAARVDELIDLMGLGAYRDKFMAELSTGSRRIVDLACQIGLQPRVILFDEPSSGIAQRETEALGPLLLRIRDETGASLLVIEHDMPLITAVSDRIVALDLGAVVVEGDAQTVVNHPQVVASYLGSSREAIERSGPLARHAT